MAKNPFKKQSLMDTLTNVGIGGAANVAIDYVYDAAGLEDTLSFGDVSGDTVKNIVKIVGGAVVGGMIRNKYARAAADGVATVGVSNLISGLMEKAGDDSDQDSKGGNEGATGLPYGTIGRIRRPQYGSRKYARSKRVAGLDDFMTE